MPEQHSQTAPEPNPEQTRKTQRHPAKRCHPIKKDVTQKCHPTNFSGLPTGATRPPETANSSRSTCQFNQCRPATESVLNPCQDAGYGVFW
jgi:hypothetical protein